MLGRKKGEDRSARKAYLGRASLKKALSKKEEEWRPFKARVGEFGRSYTNELGAGV